MLEWLLDGVVSLSRLGCLVRQLRPVRYPKLTQLDCSDVRLGTAIKLAFSTQVVKVVMGSITSLFSMFRFRLVIVDVGKYQFHNSCFT